LADIRDGFVAHLVVVQIERCELAEMLGDCGGVRVLQAQRPEGEDLQPVESQQLARQAEQAGQVAGQLIQNPALKLLGPVLRRCGKRDLWSEQCQVGRPAGVELRQQVRQFVRGNGLPPRFSHQVTNSCRPGWHSVSFRAERELIKAVD